MESRYRKITLMKNLVVGVPAFEQDGKLHCVLKICLAILIMYNPMVIQDIGPTILITHKLSNAAFEVRLTDPNCPNSPPDVVLRRWSEVIRSDYEYRCREHYRHDDPPDFSTIAATTNQTLKMVSSISKKLKCLVEENTKLKETVASQGAMISSLRRETDRAK